ncbi:type II secretion system minor pseudopilin GspH [Pseudomonas sp. 5P_3.1_Bac2]|uniref:type II secretion system minor pseudopilin GspH n=1 Tax=Pseudomonas sp. 5P_3.1_Bac2 TaxID=2971617 RepID=UPI0021C83EFD|nr:type II secretion system minor pseudopilin GspH [Pseudomonas sp. 5P_3.1_Bac2]MCU1716026.1 type II secretion system minor pseudopilin GspH [Pseudomonas sp. 5P_3.1_Bac2]
MRQRLSQAQGFTLIELLVVLVILGCLIGLTVFSVGIAGPGRELQNEAERLASLIGVLAEEAVLDNREYGLQFTPDSYQTLRYDSLKKQWQAVAGKPHKLPDWAQIKFELEGEALRLADSSTGKSDDQDNPGLGSNHASKSGSARKAAASTLTPQLLLLSSGEISPFRLQIGERRADGVQMQLSSDGFQLPKAQLLSSTGRKP